MTYILPQILGELGQGGDPPQHLEHPGCTQKSSNIHAPISELVQENSTFSRDFRFPFSDIVILWSFLCSSLSFLIRESGTFAVKSIAEEPEIRLPRCRAQDRRPSAHLQGVSSLPQRAPPGRGCPATMPRAQDPAAQPHAGQHPLHSHPCFSRELPSLGLSHLLLQAHKVPLGPTKPWKENPSGPNHLGQQTCFHWAFNVILDQLHFLLHPQVSFWEQRTLLSYVLLTFSLTKSTFEPFVTNHKNNLRLPRSQPEDNLGEGPPGSPESAQNWEMGTSRSDSRKTTKHTTRPLGQESCLMPRAGLGAHAEMLGSGSLVSEQNRITVQAGFSG